ncbi:MAG TPA: hypothetical protein VF591_21580 [Pyrinomonadaceae bacterium]
MQPSPSLRGGPAPGPGPAPAPVPAPRFDGTPEPVPTLTFIVEPRSNPDDFIDGANTYHANCGLQPQTIRSIEHLLTILSGSVGIIPRMRIVTHATPDNMAVAMFDNDNTFKAMKDYLRGFAQDDAAGVFAVLGALGSRHFAPWSIHRIEAHLRAQPGDPLGPFGAATPGGDLREFIFHIADLLWVTGNQVQLNNANIPNPSRARLEDAITALIERPSSRIVGTTIGTHVVTAADLNQLRTAVLNIPRPVFNIVGLFNVAVAAGNINPFPVLARAAAAIRADFRGKLNLVKARFNRDSWIDIRGCRAGEDSDYLRAVREFFGREHVLDPNDVLGANDPRPHVSAPRWFQYFGPCAYSNPTDNAAIRTLLLTNTAETTAADIAGGFADWARRSLVDPSHKLFWLDLVADAPDGVVIRFSLMDWRANLPQLPLQTPGLAGFAAMNFRDALNRIRQLFNVAAAVPPAGADLDARHNFVTNQLRGYGPNLLAQVSGATDAARLRQLYQALSQINQDLSQAFAITPAPASPTENQVRDLQTALIRFIESNNLAQVRAFMAAVRQRIEDANDPGIYYYMLHAGLPVFIFATQEQMVAGHRVNVRRNRLVVLDRHADAAYRQWPQLLWADPLPAGNTIGALHPGDREARRFAMMVFAADPGPTAVASCPHPDYNSHLNFEP